MSPQDILSIIVIFALVTITVCAVFITYFLVKALKAIANLASSLDETSQSLRNRLQMRLLTALPAIIAGLASRIFKKRG